MKHRIVKPVFRCLVAVASSVSISHSALASDAIGPGDSNSKWVVGGIGGAFTNPYTDEDNQGFFLPTVEYRGERFFVKDGQIGYSVLQFDSFSAGILLTGHGSYLHDEDEYDDNENLVGLKERKSTLDGGLYLMHRSDLGLLKLSILDELSGKHNGQSADLHYTFDIHYRGFAINPVIGVVWNGADMVNHFYGVSEAEANARRDAYEGKSTTNVYTGVRARYQFDQHWDAELAIAYSKLGSGISDSSIVEEDDLSFIGIGTHYNF